MKNINKIKILIISAGITSIFSFNKINAMEVNVNKQQLSQQNEILNQTYQKQVEKEITNILVKCEEINEKFNNNTEYKSTKEIEFIDNLLTKIYLYLKDYEENKIEKSKTIAKLPKIKENLKMLLMGFIGRKIYAIEQSLKEINEDIKKQEINYNKTIINIIKFDIEKVNKKILKIANLLDKYKEYYEKHDKSLMLFNLYDSITYNLAKDKSYVIYQNYLKLIERINSSEKNKKIFSSFLEKIEKNHIEKQKIREQRKLNRLFGEKGNNVFERSNISKKRNKTFDRKLKK